MAPKSSPERADNPMTTSSIFSLIHDLHSTITSSIDTSLTWEQLNSPAINYTLIRPIIDRLDPANETSESTPSVGMASNTASGLLNLPVSDAGESARKIVKTETCLGAVLFALMANRLQFLSLAGADLSYAPLQTSRAAFCELLAMKVMRKVPHPDDEAQFAGELVRGFCAFDGAPEDVWNGMGDDRSEVEETRSSALELAIISMSKRFLSLPIVQHLIHEIYIGRLVYAPTSSRALITDTYISERTKKNRTPSHSSLHRPQITQRPRDEQEKLAEVYQYNPYEAGWLDHGRMRVPKWRKWLEFMSFALLLILFIATLAFKNLEQMTVIEGIFIVFTAGFILDEFATSQEHGWTVYAANAWNVFDLSYIVIFMLYFVLRVIGLSTHSTPTSDLGFDILACGACILFPRLVFFVIKDNVVLLALRGMVAKYLSFMGLVILAFSGICFCLWTLGRGTWTVRQITWLMLQIWFGSSYLGFSSSESFHPIFGPIILISYAALCNTLLITILISILSNEFLDINANAQEEHLFQRVVKTVEGVKSDFIFSYLPPVNLFAFVLLTPLSWVVSQRTLHRVNVFCIRATSLPFLLGISFYERWQYRSRRQVTLGNGDAIHTPGIFDSFMGGGSEVLISSVFEAGPPAATRALTPRKASKTARRAETDARHSDSDTTDDGKGATSPLASLWAGRKKQQAKKGKKGVSPANDEEIEAMKDEVKAVRESQLRMEEMLAKVLSSSK